MVVSRRGEEVCTKAGSMGWVRGRLLGDAQASADWAVG